MGAIRAAEKGNRGEVRVHLERRLPSGADALGRARALLGQLGMHKTRDGTGVLLYVALQSRKVAVFAGPGVHRAGETGFWKEVVQRVSAEAAKGRLVEGIIAALEEVGRLLRAAAPGEDSAGNELPDAVTTS